MFVLLCVIQLDGHMIGVMNLTLEEDIEMYISDTASNSKIVNADLSTYPNGTHCFSF
ncbi:hypothetical protein DPMN_117954 [Dreissena polymorpha]|uniref:Uncharacterized protein n=1 Tax=Dreissena polymorpha TaxID=45954 RepID=A0A9D4JPT0_DREPO|nr:hypothetical protein DPMN_117954 [Dreissena polymorpha]